MSSLQRLVITTPGSSDDFKSVCNLAPGQEVAVNNFADWVGGVLAGTYGATFTWRVGATLSSGTLTVASTGSTAAQTCTVCNVTFTARASAPAANEFVFSTTPATQAANMAAAINASANLAGIVSATSLLGVVTITSIVPGLNGNGFQLSAGTLSNVTAGAFAGGTSGTGYAQSFATSG